VDKNQQALDFVNFKTSKITGTSIKGGKGLSIFSDLNENEIKKGKLKC